MRGPLRFATRPSGSHNGGYVVRGLAAGKLVSALSRAVFGPPPTRGRQSAARTPPVGAAPARRTAALPIRPRKRGLPTAKSNPAWQERSVPRCASRSRGRKCASRKFLTHRSRSAFVSLAQLPDASRKNAYAYGEFASGPTYYNYFRDYDPAVGRYVQSDPIGLRGGLNTYMYARGQPLMRVDPSGLVTWTGKGRSTGVEWWSYDEFELTSECKCGIEATITVDAYYFGVGFGGGRTGGAAEFEDHFPCPNGMAFEGIAMKYSFGGAIGFGSEYSRMRLGAATSAGWSTIDGIGGGVGFSIGKSTVGPIRVRTCSSGGGCQ